MNYIKHLTGFFEKVSIDHDLNPTHISLYMSIFQMWNQNRFQNPIGISRDELMRISKIASSATYHKCIKELHEKGYVKYSPSFNPFKGSILEVINLDFYTKPIPKKEIKRLKSQQKNEQVIEQPIEQLNEQAVNKHQTSTKHVPYINNTNIINIVNREEKKVPPKIENVQEFFKEKKVQMMEAEKFFNHFQSNGWLVGWREDPNERLASRRPKLDFKPGQIQ
ncbi:transcriptional regulator [Flavobacterium faecale]|uniref:transcriptional regulator n=1 Tax=Flavobacterium faecale TaxID=1355330 RepID=UPI003AAC6CFE